MEIYNKLSEDLKEIVDNFILNDNNDKNYDRLLNDINYNIENYYTLGWELYDNGNSHLIHDTYYSLYDDEFKDNLQYTHNFIRDYEIRPKYEDYKPIELYQIYIQHLNFYNDYRNL